MARVLYDDFNQMMVVEVDGKVLFDGHYEEFRGYKYIADYLRMTGYSVTEEDFDYYA